METVKRSPVDYAQCIATRAEGKLGKFNSIPVYAASFNFNGSPGLRSWQNQSLKETLGLYCKISSLKNSHPCY